MADLNYSQLSSYAFSLSIRCPRDMYAFATLGKTDRLVDGHGRTDQVSGVKKSVKEQGDIWVVAKTLKAFNRLRVAWEEDYGATSIPVEPPPARWADCSESDWVSVMRELLAPRFGGRLRLLIFMYFVLVEAMDTLLFPFVAKELRR